MICWSGDGVATASAADTPSKMTATFMRPPGGLSNCERRAASVERRACGTGRAGRSSVRTLVPRRQSLTTHRDSLPLRREHEAALDQLVVAHAGRASGLRKAG